MRGTTRCLGVAVRLATHRTTAKRKAPYLHRQRNDHHIRKFSAAPRWLAEEINQGDVTSTPIRDEADSQELKHVFTIEDLDEDARAEFDRSSPEEQQEMRDALRTLAEVDQENAPESISDEMSAGIDFEVDQMTREQPIRFNEQITPKHQLGFWASGENDEFTQVVDEDDDFQDDDMTTPAHAQLDLHRDMREYQRRIAWDMPLLRKFAKPFTPPALTTPLRFRYTTYMGEEHPAANKVVVQLCLSDLDHQEDRRLTQIQKNKLIKLAGVRYNPSTDIIKMSSEKFESQAQNKRYLGDLINQLIAEATDPTKDDFEDIPFDFRHHKPRKVFDFPQAWKLGGGDATASSENVRRLIDNREQLRKGRRPLLASPSLSEETTPMDTVSGRGERGDGDVVDGDAIVRSYLEAVTAFQATSKPQTVLARSQGHPKRRGQAAFRR